MVISLIAAMTQNRVIGKDNQMPWHLPADLGHFKRVTLGKPVVMGRKTYESIGRPLPGRLNIVLTRAHPCPEPTENLKYAHTPEQAIALADGAEEVMIIGGETVYKLFLPFASRAYLTYIDTTLEGDATFPLLDDSWQEKTVTEHPADTNNRYNLRFTYLEKQ